mmetsp:Transcript_123585/g.394838  ORF Transcript_123585/g.394838 Transcript_123585/m.394838 type:complete len:259 (+) Transcript_123585:415-1191(+)
MNNLAGSSTRWSTTMISNGQTCCSPESCVPWSCNNSTCIGNLHPLPDAMSTSPFSVQLQTLRRLLVLLWTAPGNRYWARLGQRPETHPTAQSDQGEMRKWRPLLECTVRRIVCKFFSRTARDRLFRPSGPMANFVTRPGFARSSSNRAARSALRAFSPARLVAHSWRLAHLDKKSLYQSTPSVPSDAAAASGVAPRGGAAAATAAAMLGKHARQAASQPELSRSALARHNSHTDRQVHSAPGPPMLLRCAKMRGKTTS